MILQPSSTLLGYKTACEVLRLGRAAFFGSSERDLPIRTSEILRQDDLTPSFGFVGARYTERRVLFLGINPGNGPSNDGRTPEDGRMMPQLRAFAAQPTPESFVAASRSYCEACVKWPIWTRHCAPILKSGRLDFSEIAYANALPWRTASQAKFDADVAANAALLFAGPLINELEPKVVIALGKRASDVIGGTVHFPAKIFVWNRAQAATSAVVADRERTARAIMDHLRN